MHVLVAYGQMTLIPIVTMNARQLDEPSVGRARQEMK